MSYDPEQLSLIVNDEIVITIPHDIEVLYIDMTNKNNYIIIVIFDNIKYIIQLGAINFQLYYSAQEQVLAFIDNLHNLKHLTLLLGLGPGTILENDFNLNNLLSLSIDNLSYYTYNAKRQNMIQMLHVGYIPQESFISELYPSRNLRILILGPISAPDTNSEPILAYDGFNDLEYEFIDITLLQELLNQSDVMQNIIELRIQLFDSGHFPNFERLSVGYNLTFDYLSQLEKGEHNTISQPNTFQEIYTTYPSNQIQYKNFIMRDTSGNILRLNALSNEILFPPSIQTLDIIIGADSVEVIIQNIHISMKYDSRKRDLITEFFNRLTMLNELNIVNYNGHWVGSTDLTELTLVPVQQLIILRVTPMTIYNNSVQYWTGNDISIQYLYISAIETEQDLLSIEAAKHLRVLCIGDTNEKDSGITHPQEIFYIGERHTSQVFNQKLLHIFMNTRLRGINVNFLEQRVQALDQRLFRALPELEFIMIGDNMEFPLGG